MSEQMTPERQNARLNELALLLIHSLPGHWNQLFLEYRCMGSFVETQETVLTVFGSTVDWQPPFEIHEYLQELRYGLYDPDRGTWTSAKLQLVYPSQLSISYDMNEPNFNGPIAAKHYHQELELFPRDSEAIPDWLAERGTPIYQAPVYDGKDEQGRPIAHRPRVHPQDRDRILNYLENAPVIVAARSYGKDEFDPEGKSTVPLTFHTDGTWVWAGAVPYYLGKHHLAPVPQLIKHIRQQEYQVPKVGLVGNRAAAAVAMDKTKPEPLPDYQPRVITDAERRVLDKLRWLLEKCGVPEHEYGIIEAKPDAEVIEPAPDRDGWQINFWELSRGPSERPSVFPDVTTASKALLGMLAFNLPDPIKSLPDEPPLSLLRDRQEITLRIDTELDRFGGESGNLVYEVGTSFAARSLPADWANRPYHVYQVRRPIRAISGTAVPWFDQPGGGTGYFLVSSIQELLANNSLGEVPRS